MTLESSHLGRWELVGSRAQNLHQAHVTWNDPLPARSGTRRFETTHALRNFWAVAILSGHAG